MSQCTPFISEDGLPLYNFFLMGLSRGIKTGVKKIKVLGG